MTSLSWVSENGLRFHIETAQSAAENGKTWRALCGSQGDCQFIHTSRAVTPKMRCGTCQELSTTGIQDPSEIDIPPARGGNSNGLHVTQGSAPESDRHPVPAHSLDGQQERNGCVAQMDMPRHDVPPADESRASAVISCGENNMSLDAMVQGGDWLGIAKAITNAHVGSGLSSNNIAAAQCENGGCPDVGAGVLPPSVKGSPRNEVYLLASEIVDVVELAEQYRQEELEAESGEGWTDSDGMRELSAGIQRGCL